MSVQEWLLKQVEDYTSYLWSVSSDISWIRIELDKFIEHLYVR